MYLATTFSETNTNEMSMYLLEITIVYIGILCMAPGDKWTNYDIAPVTLAEGCPAFE